MLTNLAQQQKNKCVLRDKHFGIVWERHPGLIPVANTVNLWADQETFFCNLLFQLLYIPLSNNTNFIPFFHFYLPKIPFFCSDFSLVYELAKRLIGL